MITLNTRGYLNFTSCRANRSAKIAGQVNGLRFAKGVIKVLEYDKASKKPAAMVKDIAKA